MQEFLSDPLGVGMLIFGLFLNLAALGWRMEKKPSTKSQDQAK